MLNRTIELTQLAIAEAKKRNVNKFDKILLVGGSTRMPQVAERLEKEFGIKPQVCEPDESVAKGAAVYGYQLGPGPVPLPPDPNPKELPPSSPKNGKGITIIDVVSRSFGVVVYNQNNELRVSNIILRNTRLPANVTKRFGTYEDNQTNVEITIVDNLSSDEEYNLPPDSREIGKAELIIPPGLPKGTPIEITYQLNKQGLLQMHARELVGGNEVRVEIQNEGIATEKEIEEAIKRSKDLVMA